MRTIIIIILLISSSTLFTQIMADYPVRDLEPVELIVTYSLQYQEDSLPPHFTKQEDMLLLLGKNISHFLSHNSYVFEKDMRELFTGAQVQEYMNKVPPMARVKYRLYKNFPVGKISCTEYVSPNNIKYEEDLDLFNWKLCGDTATIKGYKVQKATTDFGGRSWVAWFSPEIPYSNGPYKFNGLPGLILNIHDTRNHYVFELLTIEKPEDELMIEYLEQEFVETTKQEFFKAKDAYNANLATWAKNKGASTKVQQNAARISRERNNPIELKRK